MSETSATPEKKKRTPYTARNRVMDLLARRDHSEKELRDKLFDKFSPAEIDKAIAFARENNWLLAEDVLAERFAGQMHRRNKGVHAINHKLRKMGLPSVKSDPDQELEKALQLAETKIARLKSALDKKGREKIGRFLLSRGFAPGIVRKVVYEKL